MREILFRGKSEDNDQWEEGFYSGNHVRYGSGISVIENDWDDYTVDPETVGQFTGLTDKNGKKIFEDDIVKTRHGVRRIIFEYGCFCAWKPNTELTANLRGYVHELDGNIEVIGNIHDNPELLEVK